nr:glycoside hydrolase family 65 protein [Clostridium felsineum]
MIYLKRYFDLDSWNIVQNYFKDEDNEFCESIFSIGNGYMGQRGNFEEDYTGESLQGSYMAGIYYPDKTRVGWWKNGYPEYFAKVINSTNWIGIKVEVNGENLDIAKGEIEEFKRVLNMKEGYLLREVVLKYKGKRIQIKSKRFVSVKDKEIGVLRYSITPLDSDCEVCFLPYLDGDIKNKDANYGEKFWDEVSKKIEDDRAQLVIKTKKLDFYLCSSMKYDVFKNGEKCNVEYENIEKNKFVGSKIKLKVKRAEEVEIFKYVSNVTSRDFLVTDLIDKGNEILDRALKKGFDKLIYEQREALKDKWEKSDIVIEGDEEAQQAIRYNIFQLNQTYTGEDSRLNIGPKGFTGEKYGGSTYWDTEAYCLPFYLATEDMSVARNLLLYRHNQLGRAKENAKKLGFKKGALYPMVTMNGEECHNEWEITFEEIHRNGAIAYAIYRYTNYTGDTEYLFKYGIEVLVEISRFWEERVSFSEEKNQYVILGVTGPNEYENNVNNNWYTNRIAVWTLEYTVKVLEEFKENIKLKVAEEEISKWKDIIANMYYPKNDKLDIFLQQEGYMDKEQLTVEDIPKEERPINQNWSWDRILRSCFIKQADVLQGMYFFQHLYDEDTIRRNFDFYEPKTVHESSLSPCVHSILACKLKRPDKAYELFLRTARLDLDNYNNDTEDGCHITSMAGTWMSVVEGFGGFKVENNMISLSPILPSKWKEFSFRIVFREVMLMVRVSENVIEVENESDKELELIIVGNEYKVDGGKNISVDR